MIGRTLEVVEQLLERTLSGSLKMFSRRDLRH